MAAGRALGHGAAAVWRWLPTLLLLQACASTGPRFGQPTAAAFARDDMRKLETASLEVYYPAAWRGAALRIAGRLEECLALLRPRVRSGTPRDKVVVFLTSANLNNAYVTGKVGGEPLHAVAPVQVTSEFFLQHGLASDGPGDIACHELVHAVQFDQVDGLWRVFNAVFGDTVPAQPWLESWFVEGLAQYHEGRLGRRTGRPHSPLYRGAFEALAASRRIRADDLSPYARTLYPWSGAYLTSLHFVEWLAREYGEDTLWEVVDLQARAVLLPLGVTLRFKAVYGLSIGALVERWADALEQTTPRRARPADQTSLRPEAGLEARLAVSAADGALALVSSGLDEVPTLRILEADGRVRLERSLAALVPGRDVVAVGPGVTSGLSFSADGRWLYLVNEDLTADGDDRSTLWRLDARTGERVRSWPAFQGLGGAAHPGGRRYTVVLVDGRGAQLADLDLETGRLGPLTALPEGAAAAAPAWSPSGERLAFSLWTAQGWDVHVREPDGTLRRLTFDGRFNYAPRWVDDTHLVFGREHQGRAQASFVDLEEGGAARVLDAPHAAMDVWPTPLGSLVFLDRRASGWSVEARPLSSLEVDALGAPEVAPASAPPRAPTLLADAPYSAWERGRVFLPQLRLPTGSLGAAATSAGPVFFGSVGLVLFGRDRLGLHNWALEGELGLPDLSNWQRLSYFSQHLAPWTLGGSVGRSQDAVETLWAGEVSASRTVFTAPLWVSFEALDRAAPGGPHRRFIGPRVGFGWFAGESTPYAGVRRGLGLSGSASLYPRGLGSSLDLLDVRAQVSFALPTPPLRRGTVSGALRLRALPGAPRGALRVGGGGVGGYGLSFPDAPPLAAGPRLDLPRAFAEGVRGYEDVALFGTSAALGDLRLRLPFPIDRGAASFLWVLPSVFVRQVDVELFGSAAHTDAAPDGPLLAAGAQLALRTAWGQAVPLSLRYQVAVRSLRGAASFLHVVAVSFD